MADDSFDLIVIGAGPGGYVAAIRAAQLGMKAAVVEKAHLGGICLNWGCIPTKALLRSADVYREIKHAKEYGLSAGEPGFDLAAIVKRSRGVSAQLAAGVKHLLKKNKVTVIDGHGRLDGPGKVKVEKDGKAVGTFAAKHVIVATGARARDLPGLEADGKLVWTYRQAMTPDVMPKSLLVVGSGAIGIEFASFYNTLGTKTTVVEVMERVLPVEDAEISAAALKAFKAQGMDVRVSTNVKELKKAANSVTVVLEKGGKTEEITVDRVIMAVGVVPNTEDVGLDTTKVKVERGRIKTDAFLRTDEPGVYAIGDVVAPPLLAHKASHEAIICVEKIAGLDVHPMDTRNIPGCTYCTPQVASVGLSEAKAKELGYAVKVGRFPYVGNGKAIAMGETEGMIKTVFDAKTGELLGAHMIGAEVTELIQGYVVGKTLETTEAELMHAVFPHPTLSEMMHESVLDAYGRAIHF
ncbi:Dihydrolipoyl dehydrogenase [uncultured Alphaproteobacteria bacterium]|uniref:Dihydrolipoyl dehydrogenase n=1 Tax=uncultured Alphaproteobacteria bacterium TaxID=91750 RepID=A0A212J7I9_9PROT|nr:Dihydrolipoyl dehydrogenase [uncultured Alphaproteobacteria bacterium]